MVESGALGAGTILGLGQAGRLEKQKSIHRALADDALAIERNYTEQRARVDRESFEETEILRKSMWIDMERDQQKAIEKLNAFAAYGAQGESPFPIPAPAVQLRWQSVRPPWAAPAGGQAAQTLKTEDDAVLSKLDDIFRMLSGG
jgi:hypothetical protein